MPRQRKLKQEQPQIDGEVVERPFEEKDLVVWRNWDGSFSQGELLEFISPMIGRVKRFDESTCCVSLDRGSDKVWNYGRKELSQGEIFAKPEKVKPYQPVEPSEPEEEVEEIEEPVDDSEQEVISDDKILRALNALRGLKG